MEASMLSPDRLSDLAPLTCAAADYDVVRRAIEYISEHWRDQPEIDAIARSRRRHARPNCIICSAAGPD